MLSRNSAWYLSTFSIELTHDFIIMINLLNPGSLKDIFWILQERNFYEENFIEQEPIQQNQWNQGIQIQNIPDSYDTTQNNDTFSQNNTIITTSDTSETPNGGKLRPKWMSKGVKVSMREKRRRQNLQLRRLLTPKNAQMVLNELSPGIQHEFTIMPEETFGNSMNKQYVAVVNVEGVEYKGTGIIICIELKTFMVRH